MSEPGFLLLVAAIFLVGAASEVVFRRTGIPEALWLIVVGVLMGPVFGLLDRGSVREIAPYVAAVTLVVVLFDTGAALKLTEIRTAAPRSVGLAIASFLLTMLGVAGITMVFDFLNVIKEPWEWTHALLTGSILGGASTVILMPALARAKIGGRLGSLLNLESAFAETLCVLMTTVFLDILLNGSRGAGSVLVALGKSFGIGIGVGGVAGLLWMLLLRKLRDSEHGYPITLSALLLLFTGIMHLGGSPAIGVLTAAIVVGNGPALADTIGLTDNADLGQMRGFHHQVTFLVKSCFFALVGAMMGGPFGFAFAGAVLGGVIFVARIPAVTVAMLGHSFLPEQKRLAEVAIPRGMAAGVLATLPLAAGVPNAGDITVMIFTCMLVTISIFSAGFAIVRPRLATAIEAAERRAQLFGGPRATESLPPQPAPEENPPPPRPAPVAGESGAIDIGPKALVASPTPSPETAIAGAFPATAVAGRLPAPIPVPQLPAGDLSASHTEVPWTDGDPPDTPPPHAKADPTHEIVVRGHTAVSGNAPTKAAAPTPAAALAADLSAAALVAPAPAAAAPSAAVVTPAPSPAGDPKTQRMHKG